MHEKRKVMVNGLRNAGYDVHFPEGTFYLLPRSPIKDDMLFADQLATRGVFVLPGRICEMPGYLRICLTANDDMIARALPIFAEVRRKLLVVA